MVQQDCYAEKLSLVPAEINLNMQRQTNCERTLLLRRSVQVLAKLPRLVEEYVRLG